MVDGMPRATNGHPTDASHASDLGASTFSKLLDEVLNVEDEHEAPIQNDEDSVKLVRVIIDAGIRLHDSTRQTAPEFALNILVDSLRAISQTFRRAPSIITSENAGIEPHVQQNCGRPLWLEVFQEISQLKISDTRLYKPATNVVASILWASTLQDEARDCASDTILSSVEQTVFQKQDTPMVPHAVYFVLAGLAEHIRFAKLSSLRIKSGLTNSVRRCIERLAGEPRQASRNVANDVSLYILIAEYSAIMITTTSEWSASSRAMLKSLLRASCPIYSTESRIIMFANIHIDLERLPVIEKEMIEDSLLMLYKSLRSLHSSLYLSHDLHNIVLEFQRAPLLPKAFREASNGSLTAADGAESLSTLTPLLAPIFKKAKTVSTTSRSDFEKDMIERLCPGQTIDNAQKLLELVVKQYPSFDDAKQRASIVMLHKISCWFIRSEPTACVHASRSSQHEQLEPGTTLTCLENLLMLICAKVSKSEHTSDTGALLSAMIAMIDHSTQSFRTIFAYPNTMKDFITEAMVSVNRRHRLEAGLVLVRCYFTDAELADELHSRDAIIHILQAAASTPANAETSLMTWSLLGLKLPHHNMYTVLSSLVDFLCHRNVLVRHAAVMAIHRLAEPYNHSPWSLYSPYLRRISVQVMFRSQNHAHLLTSFSNLIGISSADFLARNQAYVLPALVLGQRVEAVRKISSATNRNVNSLLLDNMHCILAHLLVSGTEKDKLIRYLSSIDDKFGQLNLDDLIRSVPIPLATELLQMLGNATEHRTTILAALTSVAYICMKPTSATRKTPKDAARETLLLFLHKHSLGIVGHFSELISGMRGKRGLPDKITYIDAIAELILQLDDMIEHAVPQITSCLQSAMDEPALRLPALEAWSNLVSIAYDAILTTLIPHTFCLCLHLWSHAASEHKKAMQDIFEVILTEHTDLLPNVIGFIPSLPMPELSAVEDRLRAYRGNRSLVPMLKDIIVLASNYNPVICEQGLKQTRTLLVDKQADVQMLLLKDSPEPVIGSLIRTLLDTFGKQYDNRQEIHILASDCLGLLGAPDPVRYDAARSTTREVILHNFEDVDAEESVHFVRIMLETQLVDAFRTATNSNVQIFLAWAIQELLKFCGLDDSVLASADTAAGMRDIEARKRWRSFSTAARETMTPLLRSRWEVPNSFVSKAIAYPIFHASQRHREWLFRFLFDLLQSGIGTNAKKLFNVFSRILREDEVSISSFLLPYVFLNVYVGCSDEKRAILLLEIVTILKPSEQSTDLHREEYVRLSRESIFSIIDYLANWSRSRKIWQRDRLTEKMKRQNKHLAPEDEEEKDQGIKRVQFLMSEIPAQLMANAALSCKAYSRALFYWEQYIRQEQSSDQKTTQDLQPLYAHLQHLYININDPDGIEGVAAQLHQLSLGQEIMMHENAGRWTAAQSSYELALRQSWNKVDLRRGLLNCLRQTGHHEVLLDYAQHFLDSSTDTGMLDLAIESTWFLNRLDHTEDLLCLEIRPTYTTEVAKVLLALQRENNPRSALDALKQVTITELLSTTTDSTWQCYDSMAKLATIHELSTIMDKGAGQISQSSETILQNRIAVMPAGSYWKQHILAIRRAVLLIQSPGSTRSLCSNWLQSAKLARKAGQPQQSYKAILNALQLKGIPLAEIEHARWWWREGHQMRAIQTIKKSLKLNVFENYRPDPREPILSIDLSLSTTGKQPKEALQSKAELLLTRWNDLAENANVKQQQNEYANASRGSQLEKPHYYLGRYYLRLLESESQKSPELQDSEYLIGEYHRQVVMGYGRAMHFGVKYIFQTLPSFLQLWLDFGEQVRLVASKAGNSQKRQELISARVNHLHHMNEKIKSFITRLPTYLYMLAFPQILSRINHTEKTCFTLLETMISKCLADYPKQALWPFMAVCKSRDGNRSSRGNTLIARLKSDAKKLQNNNLLRLTTDAQAFTDQLMHLCTVPLIKNRSTLSLTRDLDFQTNVAPTQLAVPIQSNLTVILPAQGGVGSTKHHRAFEETQPSITSFKDEVDVMNSLQKPRKITLRASDGQWYPFLVKPNDDLRKDARLMDFNGVVQKFIRKDAEALARTMKIRTYAVIALNEDHGLCEWVRNTRPFRDIVIKTYAARNIPMNYGEVKSRLEMCLSSGLPDKAFERHILKSFSPTFHDWFVEKFAEPGQWFAARLSYSRTLAVMSMVGFVLGLGDRHGENILFDETTGDAVHVDFNCLFEKGHTFDKPERVPFRLTHNLVDALGVTGVDGSFRKTCEITLRILRENQDAFNTVLESFLHDPVGEFLKKLKKSATGDLEREEAKKVLSVIANKLKGSAGTGISDKHIPLSIEGQADELIKQATDNKLLVQMYIGWTAWL